MRHCPQSGDILTESWTHFGLAVSKSPEPVCLQVPPPFVSELKSYRHISSTFFFLSRDLEARQLVYFLMWVEVLGRHIVTL